MTQGNTAKGRRPRPLAERFFEKLRWGPAPAHKPELGPCLLFVGDGELPAGKIARIGRGGRGDGVVQVHRLAFFWAHGRWPEPNANHHCDVGNCVKTFADEHGPAHIWEGTQADTIRTMAREGRMGHAAPEPLSDRFWRFVDKDGPVIDEKLGNCWPWTGAMLPTGVGVMGLNLDELPEGSAKRRTVPARRVSFFLEHGRWPKPHALLRCRHAACVRPEHVFEGERDEHYVKVRTRPCRRCGAMEWSKFGQCGPCVRARDRKRGATAHRRLQSSHSQRKTRYGMSAEEQDTLFAAQGGRCACCGDPIEFIGKQTHLDHDHKTMKPRAFVCRACNHAIGAVKESVARAQMVIEYLLKHVVTT